jgi:hypothetical protein
VPTIASAEKVVAVVLDAVLFEIRVVSRQLEVVSFGLVQFHTQAGASRLILR